MGKQIIEFALLLSNIESLCSGRNPKIAAHPKHNLIKHSSELFLHNIYSAISYRKKNGLIQDDIRKHCYCHKQYYILRYCAMWCAVMDILLEHKHKILHQYTGAYSIPHYIISAVFIAF